MTVVPHDVDPRRRRQSSRNPHSSVIAGHEPSGRNILPTPIDPRVEITLKDPYPRNGQAQQVRPRALRNAPPQGRDRNAEHLRGFTEGPNPV